MGQGHEKFHPFTKQKHRLWNRWMQSKEDELFRKFKIVRNKVNE